MKPTGLFAWFLLLALFGAEGFAEPPSISPFFVKGNDHVAGVPIPGGRTEGETIENAIPIPSLPFTGSGNTCAFANDYDEACPYSNSVSPDAVYVFTASYWTYACIDLCASAYDSKVYIYDFDSGFGFGNPYVCNDDACGSDGFRSEICPIVFEQGHTYYIVVDGYGGDCGEYALGIHEILYDVLVCPGGALFEGEEDCYDAYDDQYNSGCSGYPIPVFTTLSGTPGGAPFSLCGTSGTFLRQGVQYRDTDWYELHVAETNTILFECAASFSVRIFMIDGNNGCGGYQILDWDTADAFPDWASLTRTFDPGTYWFWVGPSVFSGVPCGSLYVMTIAGYTSPPTAAEAGSWGNIKALFR
ncbi:MAG: hypothetical protein FJY73_12630 [Candidatus Eisenbacteria bacterium]|nr:hypothetical protein [Candidatus Eisenbacteria bacterium]